MATAKANMGFALLASGKIDAGKRLADEAVADYERAGAAAETAGLLGEYAQYLEGAGDFKAALALVDRERALYDLISSAAHNRAVLELQSRYEGERRRIEIERLNRENTMKSAEFGSGSSPSAFSGCSRPHSRRCSRSSSCSTASSA